MTYDEIPPVMRAALGAHEAFRKVGFSSDDIFVELAKSPSAPDGHIGIFVTLKRKSPTNPKKTVDYRVAVGFWPKGHKAQQKFVQGWRQLVKATQEHRVSQEDLDRCWQESEPHKKATEFVLGLVTRGMLPLRDRTIKLPDGRVIELEFDAPCVFCGHVISIGAEMGGSGKPFIAHGIPTCAKYDTLPPDEFLKACNEALSELRKRSNN